MTITIHDPYTALSAGVALCCIALGSYLIVCTIGLAIAIKAGNNE